MKTMYNFIKLAIERKGISEEQAEKEIKELFETKNAYLLDLALRHYFEENINKNIKSENNPINNFKE